MPGFGDGLYLTLVEDGKIMWEEAIISSCEEQSYFDLLYKVSERVILTNYYEIE